MKFGIIKGRFWVRSKRLNECALRKGGTLRSVNTLRGEGTLKLKSALRI